MDCELNTFRSRGDRKLSVAPVGADGVGATRLALREGTHTVVVTLKGGEKKEKVVKIRAGETEKIASLE